MPLSACGLPDFPYIFRCATGGSGIPSGTKGRLKTFRARGFCFEPKIQCRLTPTSKSVWHCRSPLQTAGLLKSPVAVEWCGRSLHPTTSRGPAPQLRSTTTTSCFLRQMQNSGLRPVSDRTKLAPRSGTLPSQRAKLQRPSRRAVVMGRTTSGRGVVVVGR